ncbi:MAG: MerR family transcriptional regulator [Spirochaetaceae bacterium]|nr:MerR family transcriptional regulator [Spirochaetaceae bacterium]
MASYSIGDAERLLGVRSHVIRYWEKEVSLIQPKKDISGRKKYSGGDLRLLLRLKHLLYKRRFTVEGAREQLIREMSGLDSELRAELEEIRFGLMDLFFMGRHVEETQGDDDS